MRRTLIRLLYIGTLIFLSGACSDDSATSPALSEGLPTDMGAVRSVVQPNSPNLPDAAAPFTTFSADNPNFQYSGRVSFADPKRPDFSAPGVYITARFAGTAVAVLLEDEFKWGNNRSFFDIIIDGEFQPKLAPEKGVTRYLVADRLSAGEHVIVLAKRTEASIGRARFLGLDVAGELLAPPPKPELKIEFIGDSITAGAGVEATSGSPECSEDAIPGAGGGWGQPYNNANKTYAAVAAHELGAEYHLTAVSGIGLVRNYSSQFDGRTMPQIYDLTFPEMIAGNTWDMTVWDARNFVPNVIVVALGTNDFSPGDNPPESPRPNLSVTDYVSAYKEFLTTLREDYPDAEMFAISSPMLGNGWPQPTDAFADDLRSAVGQVATQLNAAGDSKVHSFLTSQVQPGVGCGTHPSVEQHQTLGLELTAELRRVLAL